MHSCLKWEKKDGEKMELKLGAKIQTTARNIQIIFLLILTIQNVFSL